MPKCHPVLTEEQKKICLERYARGEGPAKIASDLRISASRVKTFFDNTVPKRTRAELLVLRKQNGLIFKNVKTQNSFYRS